MIEKSLKIDARRKKILEKLNMEGQVRVSALSEELGVSLVTIRNDLAELEQDGYLERVSGGAVQTLRNFYNIEFQHRKHKNMAYKKAIAQAAADIVQDGETLMINSGTTTYYTAVELKKRRNLNIVTNSISVAAELGQHPTFRVILLGGEVNSQYSFTYGIDAMSQIEKYKADKAILSVDGISSETGFSTYHAEEAVINKLMLEHSRQSIIVADYTKLGHESFSKIGPISDVHIWITNKCVDRKLLNDIKKHGIEVILS